MLYVVNKYCNVDVIVSVVLLWGIPSLEDSHISLTSFMHVVSYARILVISSLF